MGWSRTRRTIVLRRRLKDVVGLRLSDERCVGRRSTGHFRGHEEKELAGDFKNAGREWRPKGDFEDVRVHDFLIKESGPAVPRGVYDLAANEGFVGRGVDNDTAAFAGADASPLVDGSRLHPPRPPKPE